MITRSEFLKQFSFIWSMRNDVPDVLLGSLNEVRQELKCLKKEDDYTELAEWVDDILEEEGFPKLFFPPNHQTKEGE